MQFQLSSMVVLSFFLFSVFCYICAGGVRVENGGRLQFFSELSSIFKSDSFSRFSPFLNWKSLHDYTERVRQINLPQIQRERKFLKLSILILIQNFFVKPQHHKQQAYQFRPYTRDTHQSTIWPGHLLRPKSLNRDHPKIDHFLAAFLFLCVIG